MYALYAEVVSRNLPEKSESDEVIEGNIIDNLYRMTEELTDEEPSEAIDNALFEVCHMILQDVFTLFAARNDDLAFQRLRSVESLQKNFGSVNAKNFIIFHINRLRAFGYTWAEMHLKAVKASNRAISHCPIINGTRGKGLVDILILISDSYSAMNKYEDAVHSAKLAVDIAQDYLEKTVDEIFINGNEDEGESIIGGVRTHLGPILNSKLLLIFAYFNLATQLRHGDVVEASLAWYEKAIQTAERNHIEEDIISVLLAGLADAEKYLNTVDFDSERNIQAHDTMVLDRISSGFEGMDTHGTGYNDQYQQGAITSQSNSYRNDNNHDQSLSQSNSRKSHRLQEHKPSGSEESMTSSERNDPANHDNSNDGSEHDVYNDNTPPNSHDGRSREDNNYPVENMTNNSTIPTKMSGGGTGNSSYGGGTRGYKPSKRHDPNSTNDDISHITGDDEQHFPHYFYPTPRARPKSALSKLGRDYDSISVTSALSTPKKVQQKRHSITGGETPRGEVITPGKSSASVGSISSSVASTKKYQQQQQLHQEQLYDNSEVNRIVVERSMEWNGQESTDAPTPTIEMLLSAEVKDPLLKSIQDTLSKQLNSMIHFREQVYQHKKEVKQEELILQSRLRKAEKDAAKADRQRVLSTAVEMNFERRCAHDDRVGIFDSILKAQRLKAADDIQCVERGSEHFFEGMVVDVKRSAKANSDRDRCVIVRARVNGSFDAEIIESGELLINVHPNVIRIPALPESRENNKDVVEYSVGQQVSCRAGKYGRWFTGFVEKVHVANHYKIEFADGTVEESVSHKRMRPIVKPSNDKDPNAGFDIALIEHEYYVGQEVLMRFPYGCKWRLCTVTKVRCDGEAYDVLLNGRQEAEKGVSASCLRNQGSLLYGYGSEFCPSRRALARCASMHQHEQTTGDEFSQSQNDQSQSQQQHQVFINPHGEYSLQTPTRFANKTPIAKHSQAYPATTGKKGNRQLEDANMLAVSRSDRNIAVKVPSSAYKQPPTPMPLHISHSPGTAGTPMIQPKTLSPSKKEKGMAQTPSSTLRVHPTNNPAGKGVVISTMRDRFVQEMHRNVSLLNTSATERKFARIIRQERHRIDCIVRIQAVARGYIARCKIKYIANHDISSKELQNNEFDLSTAQIDLMDRYMQALSVAIFKNDSSSDENQSPTRPLATSSLVAMKKVADLIASDLPEEFDMNDAQEIDVFENVTDPVEKMKMEMLEIHKQQLQKQRDEMKDLFAQEIQGLGSKIIRNLHHEEEEVGRGGLSGVLDSSQHGSLSISPSGVLEGFKQSGMVGSSFHAQESGHLMALTNTQSRLSKAETEAEEFPHVFGIDDTLMHDIDWMKDMYLQIWGNSTFPSIEVIAIIAKSQTAFTIMDASIPEQLYPVVHQADSHEFIQLHHIFFVKTPENKENFAMKVRLENATGKACKLKCPGDKISDLCQNKKTVKITLDSKNQFDIASSSLRLDLLTQCLENLWDAHVAWMAQKLLIRIALHRVVQGISALFVSFPGAILESVEMNSENSRLNMEEVVTELETTEGVVPKEVEGEEKKEGGGGEVEVEGNLPENLSQKSTSCQNAQKQATWISHRYILFQELSSIVSAGQTYFKAYQESHQQIQDELTEILMQWRFFKPADAATATSSPAYDLSAQLYQLADTLFSTFEVFFSAEGSSASCRNDSTASTASATTTPNISTSIDPQTINDQLHTRYQYNTIQPILKDIYVSFIACFGVESVFQEYFLDPLLTISHQKLVTGFAYGDTYDWQSLCAHTKTWAFLLQGRTTDVSSPEFQVIYAKFLDLVLQADAEVYAPAKEIMVECEEQQEEKQRGEGDVMYGQEVITAIEDFASRALSNAF